MVERKGVVTVGGNPVTLVGPEIKVGDKAPDFTLQTIEMEDLSLSESKGKVRVISVVTSLDTSVCDIQTQWFEKEASQHEDVIIYTISMDLPFAQARYCGAHDIKSLKTLSDHRDASFGMAYGVLMKESRLLSRAVFIVDKDDIVRYVEYVKENSTQPDYDKALKALESIVD